MDIIRSQLGVVFSLDGLSDKKFIRNAKEYSRPVKDEYLGPDETGNFRSYRPRFRLAQAFGRTPEISDDAGKYDPNLPRSPSFGFDFGQTPDGFKIVPFPLRPAPQGGERQGEDPAPPERKRRRESDSPSTSQSVDLYAELDQAERDIGSGRFLAALDRLNNLAKDFPYKEEDILFLSVVAHIGAREYEEADGKLAWLDKIATQKERYYRLKGNLEYIRRNFGSALSWALKAADVSASLDNMALLAKCQIGLGKKDNALQTIKKYKPKNIREETDVAVIRFAAGDKMVVVELDDRYPDMKGDAEILGRYSQLLIEVGEIERADRMANEALSVDPGQIQAKSVKAEMAFRAGLRGDDIAKAIDEIERFSSDVFQISALPAGMGHLNSGRGMHTLPLLQKGPLHMMMAWLFENSRDYGKAYYHTKLAIENEVWKNSEVEKYQMFLARAGVELNLGMWNDAAESIRESAKIAPKNVRDRSQTLIGLIEKRADAAAINKEMSVLFPKRYANAGLPISKNMW